MTALELARELIKAVQDFGMDLNVEVATLYYCNDWGKTRRQDKDISGLSIDDGMTVTLIPSGWEDYREYP